MKKLFIAAAFLVAGLAGKAQTEKGNYIIGAQLANIGADLRDGANTFKLGLSPRAGWFLQDNFALGAEVQLGLTASKASKPMFDYGVVPFARYYFPVQAINHVEKTRFFAEASAGVGGMAYSGENTVGFKGGAGAGIAYFVSPNIALETMAKLNVLAGDGPATLSPNINLGFQIHLPTKKLREMRGDIK
ncbi:MAG: hypothetical protein QM727_02905 [Niabella sp.]